MKKISLLALVVATIFVQNKSFAQFNLPKKKGATNKTTEKTTPADPTPVQTAPVQQVPAPNVNNSTLVDPNIKPTKVVDTTVVGGFNSNNKKSLRNNYAFFSETKKRKGVQERLPLPYENLREEDALFSEFVWEEIDAREKINRPFIYQAYDDNGDQ
ncbi:MAG: hypothetical protein RL387_911, partial [Bacteroidota bacterium]